MRAIDMNDAMPRVLPMTSEQHTGLLRLRTIVRLRWIAVLGQAVTVAVMYFGLGFDLPLVECAAIITLSAALNIVLRIRYSGRLLLKSNYASAMLAYDVLQLTALLYLTGGLQNPFALLIIAPVSVSASKQPVRHTLFLGLFAVICVTLLAVFHLPLPWYQGESLSLPLTYILGVWAALVSGAIFFALYAQRIAKEARQMSEALAATETVLLREQSMSALDGLAAAAAHELGTPLSTIAVVATELLRDLPPDSPQGDDLTLLKSQTEKCREILAKLSAGADEPDAIFSRMPISHLLEEAAEPYRAFDIEIEVEAGPAAAAGSDTEHAREPVGSRNPGILYGLGNLIENAADFAETRVDIRANWDRDTVEITIGDDGPGISPAIRDRLGEPYVTTRAANEDGDANREEHGMGLGFFIAKTLLERSGARLEFANRQAPAHGAQVKIIWPREMIEVEGGATAPTIM
ncbi:MAG: ActS/PrrB/RegB family redox-sensitive histidine kinase [Methyloligellaceae bacterium]